jgi:hypothetical protein
MQSRALLLPIALLLSSSAFAQITPVGVFTGAEQEPIDGKTLDPTSWCFVERAFNNQADICPMVLLAPAILPSWGVTCSFTALSGSCLVSKGSGYSITFDTPVNRFGGYFLTAGTISDGWADFYDSTGTLIQTLPITAPADCTWNWNGWQVSFGPQISRVDLYSNESGGKFLALDSLEADFEPPPTLVGSTDQISLGTGGSQTLTMDLDDSQAGKSYLLLGSVSGTTPGIDFVGSNVPLNLDAYLMFTLLNPNTPPLVGGGGALDSKGGAVATFSLPQLSDPSLAGVTVNHAGFSLDLVGGAFVLPEVTNPVSVTLVP